MQARRSLTPTTLRARAPDDGDAEKMSRTVRSAGQNRRRVVRTKNADRDRDRVVEICAHAGEERPQLVNAWRAKLESRPPPVHRVRLGVGGGVR